MPATSVSLSRARSSRLRQAALTAGLALLLIACGGSNSGTSLDKAASSSPVSAALSPAESIALQTRGAVLNTEELNDALAEAKALPADTALVAGQVAPLAAYQSGKVVLQAAAVQLPVYRFYNTQTGSHFFTSDTTERDSVRNNLVYMTYEGQAFLAASEASAGLKPVYRFFNTQTGLHFYTISETERDNIQTNLPQFTLEGVAYYASPVAGTGLKPLYRFFQQRIGAHFYTASETERQSLQGSQNATHTYEGVGYYVLTGDCALINSTLQRAGAGQQAVPNACYLANSAAEMDITLPQPADLAVGDTLKVSGLGAGGWRISQNAGQHVQTTAPGAKHFVWTPRESNRNWTSVASSADGNKLVAVVANGQIHTSMDAGLTWTPRESSRFWWSVASSADGNKLVAAAWSDQIYTSTDAGLSWTARESSRYWNPVASSADGNKLVAAVNGGQIYTSSDAGVNWTPRESDRYWGAVASSADGNKLVALVEETPAGNGAIFTSSNGGVTWAARESTLAWKSVASSADGDKLIAVVNSGNIYTSGDAGLNWTPHGPVSTWNSVASSADGSKLVATDGGHIYTAAQTSTAPGTAGYLQGAVGSYIELKYLGNGVFEVVGSSGAVSVSAHPI